MRKLAYIFIIMFSSITCAYSQWPTTDPSYQMVFGDDFNDTTGYNGRNMDYSKWLPRTPWNIDSTKATLTYYAPYETVTYDLSCYNFNQYDTSNIHVIPNGIGVCRLIATKGTYTGDYWDWANPPYYYTGTFNYRNGSLSSTKEFRFGYFEIRFWLPTISTPNLDNNYLPTCWLFHGSDSLNPPMHSEIDIFEIDGFNNRFTNSIYFKNTANETFYKDHASNVTTVSSGTWHTAGVDWTKEHIDFYYDGNFIRRDAAHGDSLAPMQALIEAYVPNFWSRRNINSNTTFPYVYEIDYYKVWQQKEACDTSKTYTNATTATFNSKIYKDLTLNTNCYFNNGTASALGTDFVLLDVGTTIDANMNMLIDVKPCSNPIIAPALIQIPQPTTDVFKASRTKSP